MNNAYPALGFLIDGRHIDAGTRETLAVVNPSTEDEIARLPLATTADLDAALDAAARGFQVWRRTAAIERAAVLHRAAALLRERIEQIAAVNTLEQGKLVSEARWETVATADILDWAAEEGRREYGRLLPSRRDGVRRQVMLEPIGPAAGFSPWNGPALLFGRKIAEALAAGCSCVMKPAEETPGTALVVAQALADAGLPPGVLNIIFGVPPQVSTHLISSPVIRKASFTGSVEVGRTLARLAADSLKPITLELGGHAPVLVFEDADVEKAAAMTVATKFRFGGQVCTSPTRFLVHESVYAEFVRRVAEGAAAIPVGDGFAPGSQMGPLANARRLRAMEQCVADALAHGARLDCGGRRIGTRGYFFEPTVLSDVSLDCEIMNREPFGPIFAVRPFRNEAEAVAEANRLPFGLAAYAFTRSPARAEALVESVDSGLLGINTYSINVPETPFGGVKHSGIGAEGGQEGVRGYLVARTVATAL